MFYEETKIYSDGSHYIAIPKTTRPTRKKKKASKDDIELKEKADKVFEENKGKKKVEKKEELIRELKGYFEDENEAKQFADEYMEKRQRNLIERRKRLSRKINIGRWNYFCTFTYDDKLHDEEWEKLGIARYVTWPRTVCSIEGHDVKGNPLKGNYLGSDKPMADGFKANAAFFKLGFLDKTSVALGRQFKEMLPTLWMKAGAIGRCPTIGDDVSEMLILPENKFAVLVDEMSYMAFEKQIAEHPEIETIYIVTDSEPGYREMIAAFEGKNTYQLYRDYLDNFRINTGR